MNEAQLQDLLQRSLITGSGGMVGSYIDFGLRTDHHSLDVSDLELVRSICRENAPKLIIHLAADTDFDRCAADPAHAYMVNAVGTYNMATAARELGAKLVYISTVLVFDGKKETPYTEDDVPSPQVNYGHSKYLGELAVKGILDDYIIARLPWMFGGGPSHDKRFVAKIIRQLDQSVIKVVKDIRGSPTYGKDLVAGIKQLVQEEKRGTYHLHNDGTPTRADITREIVKITGSKAEVEEVDASFFGDSTDRFDNESMASKFSPLRPWQEALREYIETEWAADLPVLS